jgi:hypothetical protein
MFVPTDAVPSAFVGLGRHSFFRGHDSFFLGAVNLHYQI